ncbi:MAG: TatD family hydrolase, partial [Firmicutes bacterium]|nr:TatD family hydrolase [Bacillota bacterium]
MLFDSHTHLNNDTLTEEERAVQAQEIEDSQVKYICDIGFDMPSSRLAVEHANKYPWCYAVVGMHPHDSKDMTEEGMEELRRMSKDPKVVAIGEIGLDFHYDLSPRDDQRYWFRRQIRLANELAMPIVVHSREADRECMDILIEEGAFSDERKKL